MRTLQGLRGVWVTAWDGRWECGRFLRALERGYPPAGYAAFLSAPRAAIIFIGFTPGERDALVRRLRTSPLRFTQAGRSWTP